MKNLNSSSLNEDLVVRKLNKFLRNQNWISFYPLANKCVKFEIPVRLQIENFAKVCKDSPRLTLTLLHLLNTNPQLNKNYSTEIIPFLNHTSWLIRLNAIRFLRLLKNDVAIKWVQTKIMDPHEYVRLEAVATLREVGYPLSGEIVVPSIAVTDKFNQEFPFKRKEVAN